jgi:hypothetical protein
MECFKDVFVCMAFNATALSGMRLAEEKGVT